MKKCILLILSLLLTSCGNNETRKKSSQSRQTVSQIYNSSILDIKVYYEAGAEPYTDQLPLLNLKLWDLFQVNMNALFEGRGIVVKTPKTLSEMTLLSASGKKTWSISDVQTMAQVYSVIDPVGTTSFQIFFVNGHAEQSAGIIGFQISNTKIIVIFKDVIKNSSNGDGMIPKYVEQATLIHEMGHALGLVNNELPMISPHQDEAHGKHCSSSNCVMYHANEGAGSLINYVSKIKDDKNLIMFDQQCLDDARNFQK